MESNRNGNKTEKTDKHVKSKKTRSWKSRAIPSRLTEHLLYKRETVTTRNLYDENNFNASTAAKK